MGEQTVLVLALVLGLDLSQERDFACPAIQRLGGRLGGQEKDASEASGASPDVMDPPNITPLEA
jgi:hypothetical protein